MIRIENLSKSYRTPQGRHYVFKDLNIELPTGKSVALIGRNGAGKSTLLRMIGGIDRPDSGRIITNSTISWPVGLAGGFQGSLTGRENVKFVARLYAEKDELKEKVAFVEEFAELGKYFDMPIKTYSSGMRSRLGFGLSMAFKFDYYLVDEVTAVGDARFKKKCADLFKVNGIIPYFIFSDIAVRSLKAIEANKGLFNYRPVKPIDTIIARALLETMIYIMVYAVMMGVLWLVGEEFSLARMLLLICTWFLLVILSCGIGLIFMIIGSLYPESEKFLPIIIKPFYFISCVMFPLHAVPKDYWPYLLWNPLVHVVELSREAVVENYISDGVELSYLAFCSLVVFFVGLISYRLLEESVLTSS